MCNLTFIIPNIDIQGSSETKVLKEATKGKDKQMHIELSKKKQGSNIKPTIDEHKITNE